MRRATPPYVIALVQRHVGDDVGRRRPAHHAEGVDDAAPRRLRPLGAIAPAERADGPRVVVRAPAGGAALQQQPALPRRLPERFRLGTRRGREDLPHGVRHDQALSMIRVAVAWRGPSEPAVPWARARSPPLTCTAG